jgi:hypothetical protein
LAAITASIFADISIASTPQSVASFLGVGFPFVQSFFMKKKNPVYEQKMLEIWITKVEIGFQNSPPPVECSSTKKRDSDETPFFFFSHPVIVCLIRANFFSSFPRRSENVTRSVAEVSLRDPRLSQPARSSVGGGGEGRVATLPTERARKHRV